MSAPRTALWTCLLIGCVLCSAVRGAIPGDLDGDGDVDSADLGLLENCVSGPGVPYAFGCVGEDMDTDGDVDQADFGVFQRFLGSGVPMGLVPAGEFQMGDQSVPTDGNADEQPVHAAHVDSFHIGRYEVTNQQYAEALNWAAGQGNLLTVTYGVIYKYNSGTSYPYCDTTTSSSSSRIAWNGSSFSVTPGKENHPVVFVSWYGSVAYANWRSSMQGKPLCYDLSTWTCNWGSGYRLPTEAEWEKAARGGEAGHRFPWSDTDTIQHTRANYVSLSGYPYDNSLTRNYHPLWGVGTYPWTSPVGFFNGALRYKTDSNWPGAPTSYQTADGANGYGLYDMAGNVREWCNDWYSAVYYSVTPYPHNNPRGPATAQTYRILRGGFWRGHADECRSAKRYYDSPNSRINSAGFRLVIDAN